MILEELANKKNADVSDIVEYLESKGCRIPSYGQYELSMDELRCVDYKMLREECTRLRELTITDNIITHALVDNIADLGIFVSFPNGKKGLIHYSQIKNWNIDEAKSRYSKNQWIKVFVLSIREDGKINLSLKKLTKVDMEAEQERRKVLAQKYASKFERGAIYEAEVVELSKHEARISINGIDGYIEKDELNWNEINSFKDSLFEEEVIHAVFLEYKEGKLLFGLKYLNEKPYDDNLYDLSLSDLLKYAGHDSNVFIGIAKQSGNFAFIENLYSCDENQKGKLLVDPIFGYNLKAVVIKQFENQIADGEYYKVKLSRLVDKKKRLERNQLFQFTAEIIDKADNPYKKDVDSAFKKLTSPAGNVAIAHLLKEVVGNMLAAKDRMFFELVQNADDAASRKGVQIKVKTEGDFLVVSHNGLSFDKDDFDAIVSAANGTKKTDENKTGYKGIGFKTVFKEANRVFIKTGGYQFKFDKSDERFTDFDSFYFLVNDLKTNEQQRNFLANCMGERNKFKGVEDIPWQLEPIWVDMFPESLCENFTKPNVSIALEIGKHKIEGEEGYCQAIESIINNPKFMLFLRNTNRIDFNDKSVSKTVKDGEIVLKNSFNESRLQHYKILDYNVKINALEERNLGFHQNIIEQNDEGRIFDANFIDDTGLVIDNIPSKIALNESTTISFAIPLGKNGTFEPNKTDISIFAFLPTLVKEFDFSVFVNANFLLTPDRQHILGDNPWNYFLMEELADKLVELAANLCQKKDYNALNVLKPKYFEYQTPDVKQLAEHFNSAYKSALESEAFILNHKGELAKQDEIIIDKTGLSEIIGADLFCKLLDTEKCLPSEKIDSKILEEDIFEHIKLLKFEDVIEAIADNSDFNDWYISASDEQKKELYKWIEDNDITSRKDDLRTFVANLPLFQFGEEYKSFEEILSSDYIVTTEHIIPIKGILSKLGFVCSDNVFNEIHPLYEFVELQEEDDLFNSIKDRDFSELTADERRTLFFSLADFDGVDKAKLKKEIALFKNRNGQFKPLGEMVFYNSDCPIWLYDYEIENEEYFSNLDKYLISDEHVFQEIVQTHYPDLEYSSVLELYNHFRAQWTSTFTKTLIDKYGPTDDLFAIVERTDGAKHYFIEKYGKINLDSTTTADSIEYRLIRLALSSDYEVNKLKRLIFIDNRNIMEFTIAPEVSISIDKEYLFPLSEILTTQSDDYITFNQIKNLLSKIEGSDILFSLTKMKNSDVRSQLKALSTPAQYAFYVCYNIANNYRYTISITDEQFVTNVLDYFFDKEIGVLGRYIQYFSNQKITGHFINSDDYTLESERLSNTIRQWANDEEKEKFLIALGVKGNLSDEIKRRRAFLNNEPISLPYSNNIVTEIKSFLNWCITLQTPFTKDNQVTVLKEMFSRLNIKTGYYNDDYQNIKEWDNCRYIESVRNKLSIFCIDNEMPKRGVYNNVHLFTEYVGNYVCLAQNRLYINIKDKNIETILMSVCDDRNIPLFTKDDWTKLFMVSVEKLSEKENEIIKKDNRINFLEEENRKKDEIIEQYRAKYGDFTEEVLPPTDEPQVTESNSIEDIQTNAQNEINRQSGKVIERDGLTEEEQADAHREAEKVIKEKLEKDGYDCSNWILDKDGNAPSPKWQSINQVKNIINPNKEIINLVVKSAKGGYIFLSATDFEFLTSSRNNVLVIWDSKTVHSVTAEEIFNKDSNVNLIFDTEYTPKHYYAALSRVFQYVKRTTFAVKNPSYNVYDSIKSFGMDAKTEGVQDLFDDNDL